MRELPILTNCGVSSSSNSALFKLRERRFSVRIRAIVSCSERAMLLSFTSWLDWMPNSICDTNPASGLVRPSQSSAVNFVSCALSLDRILLSCIGGRLRGGLDFSQKPFYHGFRPLPLPTPGKLLILRWLGKRPFRFWVNSWVYSRTEESKVKPKKQMRSPGDLKKRGASARHALVRESVIAVQVDRRPHAW